MPHCRALLAPTLSFALAFACPHESHARVLNVEFMFTPFVGDPRTSDQVTTVAGRARVFVNGIPAVEQDIGAESVPVRSEAGEIAPSVRLPVESLGAILRRGPNRIRVEFDPKDPGRKYRAQLRWAEVTDEAVESPTATAVSTTNQAGVGVDERAGRGPLVIEREFDAPFALDRPWHHAAPVTSLTPDDRASLMAFVNDRLQAYTPDFARVYALLEGAPGIDVAAARELRCIERAHAAGLRIVGPTARTLEILTTGHAEVVLRATDGPLYRPVDPSVVAKIPGQDVRMCASLTLMRAFPPRLLVVRDAKGGWRVVE